MDPSAAQRATGKFIVDCEARRDAQGRIKVYRLPKADGGGTYEIAGINDRYHPEAAKQLAKMIADNLHAAAETRAQDYILHYTDVVTSWHPSKAVQAYLRDTAFNRGPGGAAKILQRALGVKIDGGVGPITKSAAAKIPAAQLLLDLRKARESYELQIAPPVGARAKFWKGLQNRWDKALNFAQTLL
jgi:lysozyme family protein